MKDIKIPAEKIATETKAVLVNKINYSIIYYFPSFWRLLSSVQSIQVFSIKSVQILFCLTITRPGIINCFQKLPKRLSIEFP